MCLKTENYCLKFFVEIRVGDGGGWLVVGCSGGCVYVRETVKRRTKRERDEMRN